MVAGALKVKTKECLPRQAAANASATTDQTDNTERETEFDGAGAQGQVIDFAAASAAASGSGSGSAAAGGTDPPVPPLAHDRRRVSECIGGRPGRASATHRLQQAIGNRNTGRLAADNPLPMPAQSLPEENPGETTSASSEPTSSKSLANDRQATNNDTSRATVGNAPSAAPDPGKSGEAGDEKSNTEDKDDKDESTDTKKDKDSKEKTDKKKDQDEKRDAAEKKTRDEKQKAKQRRETKKKERGQRVKSGGGGASASSSQSKDETEKGADKVDALTGPVNDVSTDALMHPKDIRHPKGGCSICTMAGKVAGDGGLLIKRVAPRAKLKTPPGAGIKKFEKSLAATVAQSKELNDNLTKVDASLSKVIEFLEVPVKFAKALDDLDNALSITDMALMAVQFIPALTSVVSSMRDVIAVLKKSVHPARQQADRIASKIKPLLKRLKSLQKAIRKAQADVAKIEAESTKAHMKVVGVINDVEGLKDPACKIMGLHALDLLAEPVLHMVDILNVALKTVNVMFRDIHLALTGLEVALRALLPPMHIMMSIMKVLGFLIWLVKKMMIALKVKFGMTFLIPWWKPPFVKKLTLGFSVLQIIHGIHVLFGFIIDWFSKMVMLFLKPLFKMFHIPIPSLPGIGAIFRLHLFKLPGLLVLPRFLLRLDFKRFLRLFDKFLQFELLLAKFGFNLPCVLKSSGSKEQAAPGGSKRLALPPPDQKKE